MDLCELNIIVSLFARRTNRFMPFNEKSLLLCIDIYIKAVKVMGMSYFQGIIVKRVIKVSLGSPLHNKTYTTIQFN